MQLINELENDLAFSVLVEKKNRELLDSGDLLPLLSKFREVLEPITERDHSNDQERVCEESRTADI